MSVFSLVSGLSPLLISIPHAGTDVPAAIKARMTNEALRLPDTDWHIPLLYDFARRMDATIIAAHYSRYVIDLNRPPDDAPLYPGQTKVPLCPPETFEGGKIYKKGQEPDAGEIAQRLADYWIPYHDELRAQIGRIKKQHGYVVLYDAHSIKGEIARLFPGRLPDLNLGTAKGTSCAPWLEQAAMAAAQEGPFSAVLNGRFIGGYITRQYGDPAHDVHAIQMELARENYMSEDDFAFDEAKAFLLRPVLRGVIQAALEWANSEYTPSRATPAQGLNPKR